MLNDENEAQTEAFLSRYPDFKLMPLGPPLPAAAARPLSAPEPQHPRHGRVFRRRAGTRGLIAVRRARPVDAPGIAAVHVAGWRSAYPGVLPDDFLAGLSVARQTAYYDRAIRIGLGVQVAVLSGDDVPSTGAPRIVGFSTARRSGHSGLAEGEVETLYVLDDYKERGLGRDLLRASARHLAGLGCRSAFAWVLRDNPAGFFYGHLGGKRIATGNTRVGGQDVARTAFAWDPIQLLLDVDA